MKISELIRQLQNVERKQGDVEVLRADGKPFTYVIVEERRPHGWERVAQEDLRDARNA